MSDSAYDSLGSFNMKPSSGVSFKEGKLESNSKSLVSDSEKIGKCATRTGGIHLAWPGFGLMGTTADSAHTQARSQAANTLRVAAQVVESWKDALGVADKNYSAAEKNNGGGGGGGGGGGPKMPALPKGGGAMPASLNGLGKDGLKTPGMNTPNLPDPNLKDPNLKDPSLKDPNLKDPSLKDPNLNDPSLNNPGLKNPDLNNPQLNQPSLSDLESKLNRNTPDMPNMDPQAQNRTDLASATPPKFTQPQMNMPDLPGTGIDPNRMSGQGSPLGGTGVGTGSVAPAGGAPGARLPGAAAGGLGSGMPMMPMMPMSGGGAGGDQEREGAGSDALRADDSVWDDDEDIAPPVLGLEDI